MLFVNLPFRFLILVFKEKWFLKLCSSYTKNPKLELVSNPFDYLSFYFKSFVSKYPHVGPVVDNWYLFSSPLPIISVLITYLILVKYVGPRYMKDRKAYDLLWAIRIFNLVQIGYNLFMIIRAMQEPRYFVNFFSFGCATPIVEYSIWRAFWHYLMNKMLDFFDTAFFVLRKKQSHVTFLHVFHHMSMVFVVWFTLKYYPGQEPIVAGFINASIHVAMYTYYLLSSFGQTFSFVYRFKKILTIAQIVQFILVLTYYSLATVYTCSFNIVVTRLLSFEAFANLILFVNFYRKTYGNKDRLFNTQKMMICTPLQSHEMHDVKGLLDENQNIKDKEE